MQKLNSMTAKDLVSERKALQKELYELRAKNSIR
jgi:ribosomal protein L29